MMRTSLIFTASLACVIVPGSLSAALASIRQDLTNGGATSELNEHAHSSDVHRLETSTLGTHAEVDQHHSLAKVHLRSVLASEVGIVHKTEYWGKIQVGSPPKEFTVIFDTGSGNLILPSERCTSMACHNHERYDPKASSSSQQVGKLGLNLQQNPNQKTEAAIQFGTGRIHGQFYQDRLCLGSETACLNANFIGTDYESESPFADCSFDGIMGLGFKDLSMGDGFNMIDDVVSQHALPHNQFSVYLKDHEEGSELSFGGYKRSQAASDVLWAPVTRESYWQIAIDDITFNNKKTGFCSNCQVAVDTGTSLMAGPSDVVEELQAKLDVKSDCSNFGSLPLLGFAIGDKVLNLMPGDYVDKAGNSMRSMCALSLMTLDVPPPKGPLFIFGDPFLRRFLTIYDRDGPRVGFAVAKHKGVTQDFAAKLIATTSGQASSNAETKADSPPEAADDEEELLNLHSAIIAVASPTQTPASPMQTPASSPQKVKALSSNSSALRGTYQSAMDIPDPLAAVANENLSWSSMFKMQHNNKNKAPEDSKKKSDAAGMLQTTTLDDADLVTVILQQAGKRH